MRFAPTVLALTLAGLLLPGDGQAAGTVRVLSEGGEYHVRLSTLKDVRERWAFRSTIRQQHDFSCGSAALATLLTHNYGRPVSEAEVFRVMYERGDQAKIQRYGFSLLDMKRYLEVNGYQADGFEVTLEQLAQARVPAITLVRENGYNHFVVIQGIRQGKVLLGDPAAGGRILSRSDFEQMWHDRILFVIRSHEQLARFDVPDHWRIRLPAPLGAEGMNRNGLAAPTLMVRWVSDF